MGERGIQVFGLNRALSKLSECSDESAQSPPGVVLPPIAGTEQNSPPPTLPTSLPTLPLGKVGIKNEASTESVQTQSSQLSKRVKQGGSKTARRPRKGPGAILRAAKTYRPPHWQASETAPFLKEIPLYQSEPGGGRAKSIVESGMERNREKEQTLKLLKASEDHGFLLRELRLAMDGWRRAWTPFQPFRYKVDADSQVMSRFEKLGGVWVQDAAGEAITSISSSLILPEQNREQLTSTYELDGAEIAIFRENLASSTGVGTAVRIQLRNRVLHLWAEGESGRAKMLKLIQVVSIAADQHKLLDIRFGSPTPVDQRAEKKYIIGVDPKHTLVSIAEDPSLFRQLVKTGHFQLRGKDESSVWSIGDGRRSDDILVLISRQWRGLDEQRRVLDKLWLAGASSTAALVRLIETSAPDGCDYLPAWTFFRGRACLLNYRIDVNGGKTLRSETLEALHKLCLLPLEGEVGYDAVQAEMLMERPASQEEGAQEVLELVRGVWPEKPRAQQQALVKMQQAGVRTLADLHHMLSQAAPPDYPLPPGGEGTACMLNYRVDRTGGKLFKAKTLDAIRVKLDFRLSLAKGRLPQRVATGDEQLQDKTISESERRALRRRSVMRSAEAAGELHSYLALQELPRSSKTYGVPGAVRDLAFDEDGSLLALARDDGVVSVLRCRGPPEEWKLAAELRRHRKAVNRCAFRPSHVDLSFPSVVLASAGSDGCICIWDLDALLHLPPGPARCIRVLQHTTSEVLCCAFSRDGARLAQGDGEGWCGVVEVSAWNPFNAVGLRPPTPTRDFAVESTLTGHERAVSCITFSHDPDLVASSSLDETVRLWTCKQRSRTRRTEDDEGGGKLAQFNVWECTFVLRFPGPVSFISFSPQGTLLIANCLSDDRAYAWELSALLDKMRPWRYQVLDCGDDREEIVCTAAAMRSDSAYVAIGLDQSGVRLWHWDRTVSLEPTFQQSAHAIDLPRHTAAACALSPSAAFLVTASSNATSPTSPASPPSRDRLPSRGSDQHRGETTLSVFSLEESGYSHTRTFPSSLERPALVRVPSEHGRRRQEQDEGMVETVFQLMEGRGAAGAWVSELVAGAEAKMGQSFVDFLDGRSAAESVHDIAVQHASDTIAFLVKSRRTMGGAKRAAASEEDPPGSKEADVIAERQDARDRIVASRPRAIENEEDFEYGMPTESRRPSVTGSRANVPGTARRGRVGRIGNIIAGPGGPALGMARVVDMANVKRRESQMGLGLPPEQAGRLKARTGNSVRAREGVLSRRNSQEGLGLEMTPRPPQTRGESGHDGRRTEGLGVDAEELQRQGSASRGLPAGDRPRQQQRRRASVVLGLPVQLRGRRGSFVGTEMLSRLSSTSGHVRRSGSSSTGHGDGPSREPSQPRGGLAIWTDEEVEKEREANEAKFMEWLGGWPKLFQVVWNSYVFRGHGGSLHESIAVGAHGRAAVKTGSTDRRPSSVLLFPPIRAGLVTEVEFLVQHMFALPQDALRVGVCTGRHRIRAGEHAALGDGGWMFGCGTGMKVHNGQADRYTKQAVQQGDKVGVVVDRAAGRVSIKVNGVNQGSMFDHLPESDDLYFVADLVCVGEAVEVADALVRQCWGKTTRVIPVDPLHFQCT